jgi:hypothetical protein
MVLFETSCLQSPLACVLILLRLPSRSCSHLRVFKPVFSSCHRRLLPLRVKPNALRWPSTSSPHRRAIFIGFLRLVHFCRVTASSENQSYQQQKMLCLIYSVFSCEGKGILALYWRAFLPGELFCRFLLRLRW